jgi:LDH2 family malate/lactate/ureidoglycolate dehydrogenase
MLGFAMPKTLFVRHGRLHYFIREVLKRLRLPAPHASRVGDALVAADLAGVEGEGSSRLPFFASRISAGLINPSGDIRVFRQDREPACAVVDGGNAMGHVVGVRSMELAIELAKEYGIAAVAARNSNDFGMAGYYARLALAEQMIGIAVSNAAPAMVPTYGTRAVVGSNPLAIAIPSPEDDAPFVLDMATTATSRAELEDALRRKVKINNGLALDSSGEATRSPKTALEAMMLLPLGSRADTGSYNGWGLALAIDALAGALSGASFGRELAGAEGKHPGVAGIGHFFLAIRLRAFSPWVKFRNRFKEMLRQVTSAPAAGAPRIYYPGEAEFAIEQERRATGIPLDKGVASELEGLARRLDMRDAWEHLVEGKK